MKNRGKQEKKTREGKAAAPMKRKRKRGGETQKGELGGDKKKRDETQKR